MTTADNRPPQKLALGVKFVLLLSAAALAGVVWIFWIRNQNTYTYAGEDPQRHVALAFSLVLLNACLVWLTRSSGSMPLRGLLAGILTGLSGMTCLLVVWAALKMYWAALNSATGRAPHVASDVLTYAPLVGLLGGLVGMVYGFVAADAAPSQLPAATRDAPEDEQATNAVDQDL